MLFSQPAPPHFGHENVERAHHLLSLTSFAQRWLYRCSLDFRSVDANLQLRPVQGMWSASGMPGQSLWSSCWQTRLGSHTECDLDCSAVASHEMVDAKKKSLMNYFLGVVDCVSSGGQCCCYGCGCYGSCHHHRAGSASWWWQFPQQPQPQH